MEKSEIKKIFYLRMGTRLPDCYFQLSSFFKDRGITLVPVELNEFNEVNKKAKEKPHLITIESNFLEKVELRKNLEGGLALSVKAKKIHFYHLTSFSPVNNLLSLKYSYTYNYFPLPMQIKEIADKISNIYFEQFDNESKWPGGHRAKLPNGQKLSA
ncbi:MAG: hypothetical protein U0T83_10280 [Bacteriovoracaceae bacterium]